MPVYEYRCNDCGKEFEYQQRMADPEKTTCEACGKEVLERLISRTAFALKGGGWYKDLYASTKPEGSSAAPPSTAAPSDGAAKTESAAPAASTPAPAASAPSTSGTSGSGGSGGSTPASST
ncbi:MAG: zinc ribbon domain-containing protein [Proteobacteria bacterium]|nr:zinc ribbon domain-containing protein [Pseudomonadota bacterium]